jgi:hypothetical protein
MFTDAHGDDTSKSDANPVDYAYGNSKCYADSDAYAHRNTNTHCYSQGNTEITPRATASPNSAASPQCASYSNRDVKTYGRLHYNTFACYPDSAASRDAASTPNAAAVAVSDTSHSC